MDFNEYQEKTRKTTHYPNIGKNIIYPTIGISGEAGEVAECVKKLIRDFGYKEGMSFRDLVKSIQSIKDEDKRSAGEALIYNLYLELGDLLWYIASLCSEMGEELNYIAKLNNTKLEFRYKGEAL